MKLKNIAKIIQKTKCLLKNEKKYSSYLSSKKNINNFKKITPEIKEGLTDREMGDKKKRLRKKLLSYDESHEKTNNKKRSCNNSNFSLLLPNINNYSFLNYGGKSKNSIINGSFINSLNNDKSFTWTTCYNEIFYREQYENLIYDESSIFNRMSDCEKIIVKTIEKFKKEKSNNNLTDTLIQKINDNITVKLSSIKIIFEDIKQSKICFDFYLPLVLTPLFYGYHSDNDIQISIDEIKQILALIITFNNSFDNIEINDKSLFDFLQEKQRKEGVVKRKKNNKLFYDEISFTWITPTTEYKVTLVYPIIELFILNENIIVNRICEVDLILFLHDRQFLTWDFYILNYLFSLKKFRKIICKTFTKCEQFQIKNMYFNLSENRKHIFNSDNLNKSNNLLFVLTNENSENILFKLKSCEIRMKIFFKNYLDENVSEPYIIKLNFSQMKKFFLMTQKTNNIKDLIRKFITISFFNALSCYSVFFDKEKFDTFSLEGFECTDAPINSPKAIENNYTFHIENPHIEVFEKDKFYLNGGYSLSSSLVISTEDAIKIFPNHPIHEWPNHLKNFKIEKSKSNLDDVGLNLNLNSAVVKDTKYHSGKRNYKKQLSKYKCNELKYLLQPHKNQIKISTIGPVLK